MTSKIDSIFQQRESDVRSYCRTFNRTFTHAKGSIIRDDGGREYIDFLAGCGSLNYGHNNPAMQRALLDHISGNGLTMALDFYTDAKAEFLKTFERIILKPRSMPHKLMMVGPTGTNAVEAAMKQARKATGRETIISFTNGFHGCSLGALAATGNQHHRGGAGTALSDVVRMPYQGYINNTEVELIEKLITDPSSGIEAPAAFLIETIQGEGGLNHVNKEWLQALAGLAKDVGALLIVDDVQAGCGRSGKFFSFDELGVMPDIITLAKSLSGYGLPMGMVLIKPEYDVLSPGEHNGTFRGNNLAFVTAKVALEVFWADDVFKAHLTRSEKYIRQRLNDMQRSLTGAQVKGRGLMQGIDVVDGELAKAVSVEAFKRGLIIETSGPQDQVLKILAPLTTPIEVLQKGLDILKQSLECCTTEQKKGAA